MKKHFSRLVIVFLLSFSACKNKANITFNFPPKPDKTIVTSNKLAQVFAENAPKNQQFNLNAETGGTIYSFYGTSYRLSPDIFTLQDGSSVTGSVSIVIKELHNPSEMILGNKPTATSTGDRLESYGEFKIDAFQGNSELVLKPQAVIQAAVPLARRDSSKAFEAPMWNGDSSIQSTALGRDFENNNVTVQIAENINKGIDWTVATDVAVSSGTALNFVIDKLGTWRNCDALSPTTNPTTVIGYFTNVFNDSASTSTYNGIEPNLLFFKQKGSNTLIKLYNSVLNPPSGKTGFLSYKDKFDIGLQGTFLAIVYKSGKFYVALQDVTIGSPASGKTFYGVDLTLSEVSESEMLAMIVAMNNK